VEPILLRPIVYIFGGGHVSTALARAAHMAGFSIGIVNHRDEIANAKLFPMASELYASYDHAFEKIRPNSDSYIVIATRAQQDDVRVLAWALETESRGFSPGYIGMLGKKRKVCSVYKALEAVGVSPAKFERIRAPIGLDIGALTPEEIAASITAELIAFRRNSGRVGRKPPRFYQIPRPK